MLNQIDYPTGYYWAAFPGASRTHIVFREDGEWWVCGIAHPIDFDPHNIISPINGPGAQQGATIH